MKGDELAAGRRGATFQGGTGSEFLHDLKTMHSEGFLAKYEITEDQYREDLQILDSGSELIEYPRRVKEFLRPTPQEPKVTVREVTKPQYEADALGAEVLVIRVDQEHSSHLIIPPSAKAKSDIGRVTAAGPEAKRAKVGELVLFDRFAAHGKEIDLVGDDGIARQNLLLNDVDILLRLRRAAQVVSGDPS